jgi:hypothetical protein
MPFVSKNGKEERMMKGETTGFSERTRTWKQKLFDKQA